MTTDAVEQVLTSLNARATRLFGEYAGEEPDFGIQIEWLRDEMRRLTGDRAETLNLSWSPEWDHVQAEIFAHNATSPTARAEGRSISEVVRALLEQVRALT